jgi:hypothetical protein
MAAWSVPRGLDAPRVPVIERAYQLASSGKYRTLQEMIKALQAEGYRDLGGHLIGKKIKDDLRRLRLAAAMTRPLAVADGCGDWAAAATTEPGARSRVWADSVTPMSTHDDRRNR